jgi:hypothetical protein
VANSAGLGSEPPAPGFMVRRVGRNREETRFLCASSSGRTRKRGILSRPVYGRYSSAPIIHVYGHPAVSIKGVDFGARGNTRSSRKFIVLMYLERDTAINRELWRVPRWTRRI